ncbi:uncharacterized protein LOC133836242 [Drosophila sulfurigaster albostrigata]|uniref:uncharacterized protein LOC133836242 n=1 Tax=Drosophila sulfurigaster albostrigata TaxID=89887 RepID=UPI002D21B5CA|nr:uncharacterized protein LOC133836242 [Drosophila sulfurigaster albostrigata]
MQIHILGIVLLAVTLNTARAGEYLTEKPDALATCLEDDENKDICLAKTIHNTIINWADGIPGKDIFGLTDPFTLNDFNVTREISADDGTPSVIHIQYSNFSVKGLSQGVITRARYFGRFVTATLETPKLVLNFNLNATINEGSKNIRNCRQSSSGNELICGL